MIGTILYRSRPVPRILPTLGLLAVLPMGGVTVTNVLRFTEQGSLWMIPGGAPVSSGTVPWPLPADQGIQPSALTASVASADA
jgi:hypothetical protein